MSTLRLLATGVFLALAGLPGRVLGQRPLPSAPAQTGLQQVIATDQNLFDRASGGLDGA